MEPNFLSTKILALTWKQPFGTLMHKGKWETRIWPTNYRGYVMTCLGKQFYTNEEIIQISGDYQFSRILQAIQGDPTVHKYGYAISIGKLTDCRPMKVSDEDRCFVQYRPGLHVHVYDEVQLIEPIPWRGTQGFTEVPKEVKEKIIFI